MMVNRVFPALGAAPRKPPKNADAAAAVQAWRSYIKDLEAFVTGLRKGAIAPDAPEPAAPIETSDAPGVVKLVNQASNQRRKIAEARAISAELAAAREARDQRSAYAAGSPTGAPAPSNYAMWTEPVVGFENADGAVDVNALVRNSEDLQRHDIQVLPATGPRPAPEKKSEIPWLWIGLGGVAIVGVVAAVRRRKRGR
jgi:hypothetical protein